jgi:hypothetical protein
VHQLETFQGDRLPRELENVRGRSLKQYNDADCACVDMHKHILDNFGEIEERSISIKRERERDLSRAQNARLLDISNEVRSLRSSNDDGIRVWKEKAETLTQWRTETEECVFLEEQARVANNIALCVQYY